MQERIASADEKRSLQLSARSRKAGEHVVSCKNLGREQQRGNGQKRLRAAGNILDKLDAAETKRSSMMKDRALGASLPRPSTPEKKQQTLTLDKEAEETPRNAYYKRQEASSKRRTSLEEAKREKVTMRLIKVATNLCKTKEFQRTKKEELKAKIAAKQDA